MPEVLCRSASETNAVDAIICITELRKRFGSQEVLKGVSLSIRAGSVVVICGPSGSGKSTLLRCINGLEKFQSGSISVFGTEVTQKAARLAQFRSRIGMVFQRFSLYPHMTVGRNLTLAPRKVGRLSAAEANNRAIKILQRVGLSDKFDAWPSQLSGGQQQRVAIARALVMEPEIMLFDEPTSALDPEIIREVLDVMRDLARQGMTMLVATHEMGFAREAADLVVFMDDGAIVEVSEPSEFFSSPKTERAKKFIEHILAH